MRLTFSDLINICADGAGQDTSTASQTFFKRHINTKDNFALRKAPNWLSEITRTFSTVADQQYYHLHPGLREIESLKITIGSVTYPLDPIHSNKRWIDLNAITFQAGAIPTKFFKRQRDVGIWPIPQAVYTATTEFSIGGGGLVRADYITGTVTATENDETLTGSGTTWNSLATLRPDDWFVLTDSNGEPRGNWYRIGSVTGATAIELETAFEETTEAGATYKIGQCSELPEEYQELPAWGALADFYASFRQSTSKAQDWNNMFWTGDFNTSKNQARKDPEWSGGLTGMINDYRDRNKSQLIKRTKESTDPNMKRWASSIS